MDAERLLGDEAGAWDSLSALLNDVPSDRREEPTVTPEGWSVKDTLHHVASWLDLCGEVLEQILDGSWDPAAAPEETPANVARVNHEQAERSSGRTFDEVEAFLAAARDRTRRALAALPEIDAEAWTWAEESGPMHVAKHVHDLRAWLAGVPSDPDVGELIQDETDVWVPFAGALEAISDGIWHEPGSDGWSAHDTAFHVAAWLETAAAGVEHDSGWRHFGVSTEDGIIDEMNEGFLAAGRELEPAEARSRLVKARTRLRRLLADLPTPSADAKRTFAANTAEHYREHLDGLRRLGAGPPPSRQ